MSNDEGHSQQPQTQLEVSAGAPELSTQLLTTKKRRQRLIRLLLTVPTIASFCYLSYALMIMASEVAIPRQVFLDQLRPAFLFLPLMAVCEIWKGFTIDLTPEEQIRHDRFHRRMAIALSLLPIIIIIATRVVVRRMH